MKVFTASHHGYNPIGACSVIVAKDRRTARRLMIRKLEELKLPTKDLTLDELLLAAQGVRVLNNGDY